MTAPSELVQTNVTPPEYAAFLSYDRDDAAIGDQVHRGLEGLGGPVLLARPPFLNLRARRVFRDVTNIATSPDLRETLRKAMRAASHFILLASPRAANSEWITFEIESWLEQNGGRAANLLVLLVDGDIVWDNDTGDFDWAKTNALPRVLATRFDAEPVYSDLRKVAGTNRSLSLRNTRFRSVVAELVASIEGRNKDEIVGRHLDVRRRIWTGTALAAVAVAILAGGLLNRAREVSRQRIITEARQSLAQAAEVFTAPGDPDNWPGALRAGLTQAQTAVRGLMEQLPALQAVDEAYMRDILETLPGEIITLPVRDMNAAFASDDGQRVLLEPNDGAPRVWDIAAKGVIVEQLSNEAVFDGNLRTFAWQDTSGYIAVNASGVQTVIGLGARLPLRPLAVSADGNNVAYTDGAGTLYVQDVQTRMRAVMLCQEAEPTAVTFSRMKDRVAGLCGNTIRVWTANGREELARFTDTLYNVVDATFTDDGSRLAIATIRAVRLWSVDEKQLLLRRQIITDPDEDEDFISAIAVDPSGSRVAINLDHQVMFCVDLATGETLWPRVAAWDWGERGRAGPDAVSKTVAYRDVDGGFAIFDACTGTRIARIAVGASDGTKTYNDRSRRVAIVTRDSGRVHIVDLRSADLSGGDELSGEVTEVTSAAGAHVHAIRTNERVRVWNTATAARLFDLQGDLRQAGIALSDDGSALALLQHDTVSVWRCLGTATCGRSPSVPSAQPLRAPVPAGAQGIWFSSDYLVISTSSGTALFRLTSTSLERLALPPNTIVVGVQSLGASRSEFALVDSDGRRLMTVEARQGSLGQPRVVSSGAPGEFSVRHAYVLGPEPGAIVVLDTAGGRHFTASATTQAGVRLALKARDYARVARSEDHRLAVVASEGGNTIPEPTDPDTAEVIDLTTGQIIQHIALGSHVAEMAFGGGAQLAIAENAVAEGQSGFRIRVFDRNTWKVVTDIRTAGRPTCLAFSDDGALLVVGQRDNTTSIVDRSGIRRLVIPQAGRVVGCEIFDAASKILTIGSTTDLTVLRVTPATRAGLARRLLALSPWID